MAITTTNIISNDPSLLIGWTSQRNQCIITRNIMFYLNCITCCINIRYRSFHPVIHYDTSLDAKLQTGFFC